MPARDALPEFFDRQNRMTQECHRIAFYADLLYNSEYSPNYWIPPKNLDVDAIVLGGDIHYSPEGLALMLTEIRESQKSTTRIVFVLGNGEYVEREIHRARRQYREAIAPIPNTTVLDDETVLLPNGLRIIGSTLWSMVSEDNLDAYSRQLKEWGLRGVDNARLGDHDLTFRDTNAMHIRARTFIESELRSLSKVQRDSTIVCTHFWPTLRPWSNEAGTIVKSPGGVDAKWYQMGFTNLDSVVEACGPRFWLCGHAHETASATVGATEILSNPRAGEGPGHVNPEFAEQFVVEVPRA